MNPLIAQIRKLREIASRETTNPHEAAAAAAIAEKLCQQHRISEATIESAPDPGGPIEKEVDASKVIEPWKSYILTDLAKMHGCAVFYWKEKGRGYEATCIGTESDVAIVAEMYAWIVSAILKQAEAGPSSPRWRKSFLLGASDGVREALWEAHNEVTKAAPSTALAVLDARLEASHLALRERHGKLKREPHSRPMGNARAVEAGEEAGRSIAEQFGRAKRTALP